MALLNVRSLTNKSFIVNDLISTHNLDITLLTETWLDRNGTVALIETAPPNFKFLQTTRTEKRGGGIAAVLSDSYSCKEIPPFGEFTSFEHLAISITCNAPILIITVYRPPKSKYGFLDEFSELLSKVSTNYDCIIISGDFDIHVDNKTDPDAQNFICLLEAFDFTQHVSGPTHNKGHTLDLVISKGLNITVPCVMDVAISDHCCIFFDVSAFPAQQMGARIIKKRIINNNTIETFKKTVNELSLFMASSIEDPVNNFSSKIRNIIDSIAPVKTKNIEKQKVSPGRTRMEKDQTSGSP